METRGISYNLVMGEGKHVKVINGSLFKFLILYMMKMNKYIWQCVRVVYGDDLENR